MSTAQRPTTASGGAYHCGVPDDFFKNSVTVFPGAGGRIVKLEEFLTDVKEVRNDKRGIISCVGKMDGMKVTGISIDPEVLARCLISGTPSGMGVISAIIMLREVLEYGPPIAIIRAGSGGSMITGSKVGDVIIGTGAYCWDLSSMAWMPEWRRKLCLVSAALNAWFAPWMKLESDQRLVNALMQGAQIAAPDRWTCGVECTVPDFNGEQAREELNGKIPPHLMRRFLHAKKRGNLYFSMELSGILSWLLYKGFVNETDKRIPGAAVTSIYAQRLDGGWDDTNDELTLKTIMATVPLIFNDPSLAR